MILDSPIISGSSTVTGNLTVLGTLTASVSGSVTSASYATNAETLDGLDSTSFTTTSSFNTTSGSFSTRVTNLESFSSSLDATFATDAQLTAVSQSFSSSLSTVSGSLSSRVANNEATGSSLTTASSSFSTRVTNTEATASSLVTASGSFSTRTTNLETASGSFSTRVTNTETTASSLTTASSSFSTRTTNLETASGSFSTRVTNAESSITSLNSKTGSYATTGSNIFNGTQTITGSLFITENLTVLGSSSISYVSQSTLNIGTNLITVNAQNPSIRFGGIAVIDSGSSPQISGSYLFDSVQDRWIMIHQQTVGSALTSSIAIMGPETYNDLGNETTITLNRLVKGSSGASGEHISNSNISDTGTVVSINSATQITGSLGVTGASTFVSSVTADSLNINTSTVFVKASIADTLTATSIGSNYNPGILNIQNKSVTNGNLSLIGFQDASAFINLAAFGAINEVHSSSPNNVKGSLAFYTKNNGTSYITEKMRLDASGNLGLGVTPSAWVSGIGRTALQVGITSISTNAANDSFYGTNYYDDGTNNRYINSDFSLIYAQQNGNHIWYNASSGTASNTISFTQAMTLNASGNLSIGNTNDTYKLDVTGTARFTGQVDSETKFYVVATPPATNGGLINVRDTVTATNVTSFAGVFFNSAPGNDYSIGKLTENNVGFLQIRNANNGNELLRINSTGAATFTAATQDAIQTVIRMSGKNASSQIKALDFKLTAGTPLWTISTAAEGTDAGINIMPNGSAGLSLAYSTGEAIFSGKTNIVKAISDYAFTVVNTDTNGYGMYIQAGSTNNAIDVYNAAGTTQLFKLTGAGAATFSANVYAPIFTSTGGRGTNYGFRLPDWQIYNTSSGNALAFNNYTTDFLYINSSGNVGIGTTSPSRALTVASDTSFYNGAAGTGAIDPGAQEVLTAGFNVAGQSSLDISNIGVTLNRWKAIVRGGFANNNEGGGLVSSGLEIEVDSNFPSIPVGSSSITFSRNSSTGKLQVTNNNTSNLRTTFVGTIHIVNYPQSVLPTISKVILGNVGINTTSPGNFNGLSFAAPILDLVGSFNVRGRAADGVSIINIGGETYRKGALFTPIQDADPYLGFAIGTSGTSSNTTERMRITSGGNVGIGTTSPSALTEIRVNTNDYGNNLLLANNYPASGVGTSISFSHNTQAADPDIIARMSGYIDDRTSGARTGSLRFYTGNAGTLSERMRITSAGRVGIQNTSPQGLLEAGIVDANSTYGGLFFSTFTIPVDTWYTVFYAPSNNQWNAITEFTWTSSGDYNRSGAAYMRWAYESGAATLGVVYTLFNNSQNATASFRKSGNEIQVYITGGAANYYVQVRIQGSKAA